MENPTLGRIEAEYLNGVRSGNVRKKRLRNRNRRIRRDRASGMSYIDLGAKYELSRAILHQIINRRWRGPPVQLALDGALARRSLCSNVLRESVRFEPRDRSYLPCSGRQVRPHAKRALHHRSRPALKLLRRRASPWWTEIAR